MKLAGERDEQKESENLVGSRRPCQLLGAFATASELPEKV